MSRCKAAVTFTGLTWNEGIFSSCVTLQVKQRDGSVHKQKKLIFVLTHLPEQVL